MKSKNRLSLGIAAVAALVFAMPMLVEANTSINDRGNVVVCLNHDLVTSLREGDDHMMDGAFARYFIYNDEITQVVVTYMNPDPQGHRPRRTRVIIDFRGKKPEIRHVRGPRPKRVAGKGENFVIVK